MDAQAYLIAPAAADAESVRAMLESAISRLPVAALLLPRAERTDNDYAALVSATTPMAQARGAAVLIEGTADLVRRLGVDGLHVRGTLDVVQGAVKALKPDYIVGAGDVRSRHDAMQRGEAGVDYILFGPLSGRISPEERELARWWADTMEVPGVLADPGAEFADFDAAGCEFIGLTVTPERAG